MEILDFRALAWGVHVAFFAAAASAVWIAGVKLTAHTKVIAAPGAGQAFVGILLLGAVASLPEMATSVSAAALGDARLGGTSR